MSRSDIQRLVDGYMSLTKKIKKSMDIRNGEKEKDVSNIERKVVNVWRVQRFRTNVYFPRRLS